MKPILLILFLLLTTLKGEVGIASHYSIKSNRGVKTASGEVLRDDKLTAAHKTLKFGTKVKITNLSNNKSVVVTINDRGPYVKNRIIDVSQAAAKILGFHQNGIAKVKLEIIKK